MGIYELGVADAKEVRAEEEGGGEGFDLGWLPAFPHVLIASMSNFLFGYHIGYFSLLCLCICLYFRLRAGILVTLVWLLRKLRKREEDTVSNLLFQVVLVSK